MMTTIIQSFITVMQIFLQQAIVFCISNTPIRKIRMGLSTMIIFATYSLGAKLTANIFSYWMIAASYLILMATYWLIHRISFSKSCLMGLGQIVLSSCLNYLLQLIMSILGSEIREFVDQNYIFIGGITAILILFAVLLAIRKTNIDIENISKDESSRLWFFCMIYLVLYILPNAIYYINYAKSSPNLQDVLNIVLFILFYHFISLYIRSIQKTADLKQQLEVQKLYLETLEKADNELRSFKHDFSNIISAISGDAELGNLDAIKKYIRGLNISLLNINTTNIVNHQIKQIPMLYGILLSKLQFAELNGIKFSITILDTPILDHINQLDLCRMVGILLDNALEATVLSDKKFMHFESSVEKGRNIISVLNSNNEVVDIDTMLNCQMSTKPGHLGRGLKQIRETIKKYEKQNYIIQLNSSYNDGMLTQTLII